MVEGAGLANGLSVLFRALNVDPRVELGDPETEEVFLHICSSSEAIFCMRNKVN